jgi:hypothetical protein
MTPTTAPAQTASTAGPAPALAGASFADDQPTTQPIAAADDFDADEPEQKPAAIAEPPAATYSTGISQAYAPPVQLAKVPVAVPVAESSPQPSTSPSAPRGQARSVFALIEVTGEECQDTCASIARTTSQIAAIAYAKSVSPAQTTVTQLPSDDK